MSSIEALINRQLLQWEIQRKKQLEEEPKTISVIPPIITVSRQRGSRGSYFATRLSEELGYQKLHKEIIDSICKSSGYRKRIVASLDQTFRNDIELMVESLFGGRSVDHQDYFKHLFKVVLSMSKLGGVILLGRGGNFILGPRQGFHIRFVAPPEIRLTNLMKYCNLSPKQAEREMQESDKHRSELVRKLFSEDIDEPHHYDMVVNSAYMDIEDLLGTVQKAVEAKFMKLAHIA